jgi:hypothetical protein
MSCWQNFWRAALVLSLVACSSTSNDALRGSSEAVRSSTSANEQTAFDYFVGKGLSREQSAGVIGNLMQESSINPTINEVGGGPGRGIAQWSAGGRWDHDATDNVSWYASTYGGDPWSLETQLDFVWYELTTFPQYGLGDLTASTTVEDSVNAFQSEFERCGKCAPGNRVRFAQEALAAFANDPVSGGSLDNGPEQQPDQPGVSNGRLGGGCDYATQGFGSYHVEEGTCVPGSDGNSYICTYGQLVQSSCGGGGGQSGGCDYTGQDFRSHHVIEGTCVPASGGDSYLCTGGQLVSAACL